MRLRAPWREPMFYKDRIRNIVAAYPRLAAVWIKTEDEQLR